MSHLQPISQQQFTRSKRQIYMSSIGRLMDNDVSCHIDRDHKRVVYQRKKHLNFIKLINCLVIKIQREIFCQLLLRFTNIHKRRDLKGDTIFLPQALLKNDSQVMKSYRQKLSAGQIDRYISLHIPKRKSSSQHVNISKSIINTQKIQKLSQHEKTIRTTKYPKNQQQISVGQSTFMYNNHQHNSKSIQIIKIKQHRDRLSNRKILQFSVSPVVMTNSVNNSSNISKRSSSNNRRRHDIIHITYKQFNLSNGNSNSNSNGNSNSNSNNNNKLVNFNSKQKRTINKQEQEQQLLKQEQHHVQRQVSTFDINEFCLQQENVDVDDIVDIKKQKNSRQQHLVECQSFFSTSENVLKQLKQNYSPSPSTNYIGKNRFKNSQVISSTIKQFDHIDIGID